MKKVIVKDYDKTIYTILIRAISMPCPLVSVFVWKRNFFLRFQSTLRPLVSFSPVHTYTMNWFENDKLPDCACLTHTCSLLFSLAKNVYACSAKMTRNLFRAMSLALRKKSSRNVSDSTLFWQWQGCNFLPL